MLGETDLTNLEKAPLFLWIQLKPDRTILATLRIFEAIEGFDQFGDPAPGTTTEDLRYVWRGAGEGFDVVIAVAYGWPAGSVIGAEDHYKIVRTTVRSELQDLGALPIVEEPPIVFPPALAPQPVPEKASRPPLYGEVVVDRRPPHKALLPEQVQIDVLMVVTEEARQDAGGDPFDTGHMAPIIAEIDEAFGQTNHAFENSDVNVRLEPAGIVRLEGLELSGDPDIDIDKIRRDLFIQIQRNQYSADIVSLILEDYHGSQVVNYCGYSYAQRVDCYNGTSAVPGCGIGQDFEPFAFNIVSEGCLSKNVTFSHEISHNFSCEHAPSENSAPEWLAAQVYAYAFFNPAGGFRTVTSTSSIYKKVLHYSDAYITYEGFSTGNPEKSWCARVIEAAASTVASFRDPKAPTIFVDDFEGGGVELWSTLVVE